MRSSSPSNRAKTAVESFSNASECIGRCEKDMSLFAVTRGQWSMIDAVLHVLNEVGPSKISLWTWTVADYEVQVLKRLQMDKRVTDGQLVIDSGARTKNAEIIADWKRTFGPKSVSYVINHSKIATVENADGLKFLLRGSMNLNFNPRFEQFDISEGGPAFDLVREIEQSLPHLEDNCTGKESYAASKLDTAFTTEQLSLFDNPKIATGQIELYSRQFATYLEAAENIQANGVIVSHPRTGQPMENPYLKVRAAAEASFGKMRMVKSDSLWAIASKLLDDMENNSEK